LLLRQRALLPEIRLALVDEEQGIGLVVIAGEVQLLEPRGTVEVVGRFSAVAAALRRGRELALDALNIGLQR
jgi:hypothetical protein